MTTRLLELTADVVASYAANNSVSREELPALIQSIHQALEGVEMGPPGQAPAPPRLSAAQIRKSIAADALTSFEDGRPYRMLRRHLTTLGLTPEQYRAKWGLPADYPMVAPSYSQKRSAMAKALGLGRRVGGRAAQAATSIVETVGEAAADVVAATSEGRGRPSKAAAATASAPAKRRRGRPRKTTA